MIKVSIAGGTGYTAGELLRLLIHHPQVQLESVLSTTSVGVALSSMHRDLVGETDAVFTDSIGNPDVLFLCLGHGLSQKFMGNNDVPDSCKVIDLGNDFRLIPTYQDRTFEYGLCELNKKAIQQANNVANPGCFATSILLALLPLAKMKQLNNEIHIHAITGSTGAGKRPSETSHFSYRSANVSVYKAFNHQHLAEIKQTLSFNKTQDVPEIQFVPMRGDFARGIFSSVYTKWDGPQSEQEVIDYYKSYYNDSPFVFVSDENISLKEVVNTNKSLLHISIHNNYIHITSIIDNLLKGASGQAIQNMNLLFGFEETEGLLLKGSAF
ncbi:MAG TPA: N-acetyl-gamma-glutamyl-phosphate reductase [Dysgonamonadaceae bacterium]|nr:N-acetyl-gamma-glutamyl-phosphate reductase [Dysgonamonadaceae bacterium]